VLLNVIDLSMQPGENIGIFTISWVIAAGVWQLKCLDCVVLLGVGRAA
jgi:hypothetical protein